MKVKRVILVGFFQVQAIIVLFLAHVALFHLISKQSSLR